MLVGNGIAVGAISLADNDESLPKGLCFHSRISFSRSRTGTSKAIGLAAAILRIRHFAPDIFVCVGLTNAGWIISMFLGRKTFRICQEVTFGRSIDEAIYIRCRRYFDGIAPQSSSILEDLRRRGVSDPHLEWLPCFAENPVSGVRASPGENYPFRIGYFGRLAPHKGLDVLISALKTGEFEECLRLDIWGGGDTDLYRSKIYAAGLSERVNVNGPYPSGRSGAELMAGYDALVLPTQGNEGLPLILLEAISYGLPLLATDVAAIADACRNNVDAILVAPTEDGLRSGLRVLVTRLRKGEFSADRQYGFYRLNFSHEVMTRQWLNCLSDPRKYFHYE